MVKPLYKTIGEAIINEMMLAGFTVIFLTIGINYFNLKYAWVNIINTIAQASGMDVTLVASEISMMLAALQNTFPFNYLFGSQQSIIFGLLIGLFLSVLGFYFKITTTPMREKLIKDLGREFSVPAFIGLFTIIAMQAITAVFVLGHFANTPSGIDPSKHFVTGVLIWNTYGKLLLVGLSALAIGSVTLVVAHAKHHDIGRLIGRTIVYGSYIAIGWYVFIRILALRIFLDSEFGPFLRTFILSGDVTLEFLLFCIFGLTFGLSLRRYGSTLMKRKLNLMKRELHEKAIREGRMPVVGMRHLRRRRNRQH